MSKFEGPWPYPLSSITRDPRLQCRTALNAEVVAEYAELLRGGGTLPAISVIEIEGDSDGDGDLLLVDGWHRLEAHRAAGSDTILAMVRRGTWSVAVQEAAGANAAHGLQRTVADKRRAVRLLLTDSEAAKLSGRELAALARVSHTMVNELRQRYGLDVGVALTEQAIATMDGEPTGAWLHLLRDAKGYSYSIGQIRTAPTPNALAPWVRESQAAPGAAFDLRAEELTTSEWPGGDPPHLAGLRARAASLDSIPDLVAALRSRMLSTRLLIGEGAERGALRRELYHVLDDAMSMETRTLPEGRFTGRPALAAQLILIAARRQAAAAAERVRRAEDPSTAAADVVRAPDAAARLAALPPPIVKRMLGRYDLDMLSAEATQALLDRATELGLVTGECADPLCDGVYVDASVRQSYQGCIRCQRQAAAARAERDDGLRAAGRLLREGHAGLRHQVQPGLMVTLSRASLDLVGAVELASRQIGTTRMDAWLSSCPHRELATALRCQLVAPTPDLVLPAQDLGPWPLASEEPDPHDAAHELGVRYACRVDDDDWGAVTDGVLTWLPEELVSHWRCGIEDGQDGYRPNPQADAVVQQLEADWRPAAA